MEELHFGLLSFMNMWKSWRSCWKLGMETENGNGKMEKRKNGKTENGNRLIDVNQGVENGMSPLFIACGYGREEMVE